MKLLIFLFDSNHPTRGPKTNDSEPEPQEHLRIQPRASYNLIQASLNPGMKSPLSSAVRESRPEKGEYFYISSTPNVGGHGHFRCLRVLGF